MNQVELAAGSPVRITSGAYEGLEGVVEDVQPECSAVRVHTDEGYAYAYKDAVAVIRMPMPKLPPTRGKKPLTKK